MLELKAMTAHVLYNFYVEPVDLTVNMKLETDIVLQPSHPVHVKFIKRNVNWCKKKLIRNKMLFTRELYVFIWLRRGFLIKNLDLIKNNVSSYFRFFFLFANYRIYVTIRWRHRGFVLILRILDREIENKIQNFTHQFNKTSRAIECWKKKEPFDFPANLQG